METNKLIKQRVYNHNISNIFDTLPPQKMLVIQFTYVHALNQSCPEVMRDCHAFIELRAALRVNLLPEPIAEGALLA